MLFFPFLHLLPFSLSKTFLLSPYPLILDPGPNYLLRFLPRPEVSLEGVLNGPDRVRGMSIHCRFNRASDAGVPDLLVEEVLDSYLVRSRENSGHTATRLERLIRVGQTRKPIRVRLLEGKRTHRSQIERRRHSFEPFWI